MGFAGLPQVIDKANMQRVTENNTRYRQALDCGDSPSRMVTSDAVLSPAQLEAVMLTMCISLYDRVRVAISGSLENTVRGVVMPAPVRV